MASDEDLKLSDTLRYYMRDTTAAKNLLYRRLRALANHEAAVKQLDKARSKNKDVQAVSGIALTYCYGLQRGVNVVVIVSIVDFIVNICCSVARRKNCSKAIKRSLKKFPRWPRRVRIVKDWPAFVVVLCENRSLRGDVTHVCMCVCV